MASTFVPVTLAEIAHHLEALGRGNHRDNLAALTRFPCFFRMGLSEHEFFGLVFLQRDVVSAVAPKDGDRRLLAVAGRALRCGEVKLGANWDLRTLRTRFKTFAGTARQVRLPELVLRDCGGSERDHGEWYLQDGSHRALAYAIAVLEHRQAYTEQFAYCATFRTLGE